MLVKVTPGNPVQDMYGNIIGGIPADLGRVGNSQKLDCILMNHRLGIG